MSTGETPGPIHPNPTQRRGLRYFFYDKHHGRDKDAAQWSVNAEIEFSVFDMADQNDLSNEREWLYGISRNAEGDVIELGTWSQQVAEFPLPFVGHTLARIPALAVERFSSATSAEASADERGLA